jgi:hypothetical protein
VQELTEFGEVVDDEKGGQSTINVS